MIYEPSKRFSNIESVVNYSDSQYAIAISYKIYSSNFVKDEWIENKVDEKPHQFVYVVSFYWCAK